MRQEQIKSTLSRLTDARRKQSLVCLLTVVSLYFRWLPVHSGILLALTLLYAVAVSRSHPTINNVTKPLLLLTPAFLVHLVCITRDSLKYGFQPIFILDLLNIATIALFALFIRTVNLDYFVPRLRQYQIFAGAALSLIPSALIVVGFASYILEEQSTELTITMTEFVNSNIDYNIMAFLLLISLNSLVFTRRIKFPFYVFSTIISIGILFSSSRRAFLLLLFLLPLTILLRPSIKLPNLRKVSYGIGFAFAISAATLVLAHIKPFKNHIISKAIVAPLIRPLSLAMTPLEFNKLHYDLVHNIQDHLKVSTEYKTFADSIGELALQPRSNRLKSAFSLIEKFTPLQHVFGNSFYLKELGRMNNFPSDYPHNFLVTSYISTGTIGLILISSCILIALLGLYLHKSEWAHEILIGLFISISFSLTSGFSYWSFLPISLYTTIGIFLLFRDKS
ncbi:hypothetical protein [Bdellovibrio bacteriovorus]|uniref:Uncharacterized protein n=1 Tax=Bdellovibrio bacteriovorus str. Tiberius TaxID=1069642 RepID=K7YNI3_BDEBC|nr:hypothetical protein [Bdellovibrio bacteriovorus]AFY01371.1 Hypothetical protein Bdt_1676 [Bdellovibrio bacteriovorus str. Tiberius]